MGNNPSANAKPTAASPAGSTHGSSAPPAVRREPKLRDSIQAQRVAAPPEPSMAQARGINITHGARKSSSQSPANAQPLPPTHLSASSSVAQERTSVQQSKQTDHKVDTKDLPSQPVAVPIPTANASTEPAVAKSPYSSSMEASVPAVDAMSYHLTRPPRLPLPIEEEVHTPGSPIIAPADVEAPLLNIEALEDDILPRRSSALSSTTADDDEDAEELPVDKTRPVVPTDFEWQGGGEKVYVTGTIFQWSRKSKLYPVLVLSSHPGLFRATISVRPGTHHVRFIVDGNMTISPDLPTTVDFGNNLVNYIEVSADDVPLDGSISTEAIGTPVPGEGKQLESQPEKALAKATEDEAPTVPPPKTKPVLPAKHYTSKIPQYLLDLDKPEDTNAYQQAAHAIEKLPQQPSLPGFLGKPILNAATPMKDDNSVLNMPNHTVLNHLATSSIKNNILAVSATTRYKRKYVTTIMYKPTTDDDN